MFGLGGIADVYIIAPLLDNFIQKISHKKLITICCILLSLFILDNIYSRKSPNTGQGITNYQIIILKEYEKT